MRYFVAFAFNAHGNTRLDSAFIEVERPIVDDETLAAAVEAIEYHKIPTIISFQEVKV